MIELKKIPLNVLVWDEHLRVLAQAAHKRNLSVPRYIREVVMPLVAKEEGLELPELPQIIPYQARPQESAVSDEIIYRIAEIVLGKLERPKVGVSLGRINGSQH